MRYAWRAASSTPSGHVLRRAFCHPGLLHHQRLFYLNATALRSCAEPRGSAATVHVELSSSYFDYPKAKVRIFSVMPRVRVAVLLREPVARARSAFNVRWLTWLCGKLMWSRADCWAAVTGEEVIRQNQVGPFQMHAALKLWRACTGGGDGKEGAAPSVSCLRADYASKLRDKATQELASLRACVAAQAPSAQPPANLGGDGDGTSGSSDAAAAAAAAAAGAAVAEAISVPPVGGASWGEGVRWDACLELDGPMTGPKQLHKKMEDGAFVWRSMYQVSGEAAASSRGPTHPPGLPTRPALAHLLPSRSLPSGAPKRLAGLLPGIADAVARPC